MAKMTRKELKHDEIAEAAAEAGHWLEDHWRTVVGAVVGVLVVVLAVLAYVGWNRGREERRSQEMAAAQALYLEAAETAFTDFDQLGAALDAFDAIVADRPGSPSGLLAAYYKALSLKHLGRIDDAVAALETLVDGRAAEPTTLMTSAHLLLSSLYVQQGREADALALLERVAAAETPAIPADQALLRLAELQEAHGAPDEARSTWRRLRDEFAETPAGMEARRQLGG